MSDTIKWTLNTAADDNPSALQLMAPEAVAQVRAFHASMPHYAPTPLVRLQQLATHLGLKGLYVKDESYRFGLNAFKVLGGSYAVGSYIGQRLGRNLSELSYAQLTSPQTQAAVGNITFYTATDGNHGRGVAWAARQMGQKCVVRMPAGTAPTRLENIRKEGANVALLDMNYDNAVRHVNALCQADPHGVMVQDTAWPGYQQIPSWIMQGYATMAAEADEQLKSYGEPRPTHILVQAGVGSLAGAVAAYFANVYGANRPTLVVVEASAADCLYLSALKKQKDADRRDALNRTVGTDKLVAAGGGLVATGAGDMIPAGAGDTLADAAGDLVAVGGELVATRTSDMTSADVVDVLADGAGDMVAVGGELATMMAGLACGEANPLAWEILSAKADLFVSSPDWVSARGMQVLAAPLGDDTCVVSGESGAVGLGLVVTAMLDGDRSGLREALGLGADSVVLCFSTEGATDPDNYRRIVGDAPCAPAPANNAHTQR